MSSLRDNYFKVAPDTQKLQLIRDLTTTGMIGGPKDANVDGSVTPVEFWSQPAPDEVFFVTQVVIEVSDAGNPNLDDYGNVSGPLTNGVQFFTEIAGINRPFGIAQRSNRQLLGLGPFVQRQEYSGNTFVEIYGFDLLLHSLRGIELRGSRNDRIGIIIQDDLTTLVNHIINVKGYIATEVAS